jgi:hypothetical protein
MEKSQKLVRTYLSVTKGAIHTLLAIFILGMIANLYIEIPAEGNAWVWVFTHSGVIASHAILGTLLVVVSIASLVLAILNHRVSWITASALGLVFTGAAAFFGSDFLSAGGKEISSLLMAFGFLGALVSYAAAVFQTKVVKEIKM